MNYAEMLFQLALTAAMTIGGEDLPIDARDLISSRATLATSQYVDAHGGAGEKIFVSRPGLLLVATDDGVRRSFDAGETFELIPGTDRTDVIIAADARYDSLLLGTFAGEVIEVSGELALRERVCDSPITKVAYATSGQAAFVECGGALLVRGDEAALWRSYGTRLGESIRSIAPDPFDGNALFVGTTSGTYRLSGEESERVAGPSDELRVVDFPTHTAIVSLYRGEVTTLATTKCQVSIENYGGRKTGVAPFYSMTHLPSSYRITVRTSAPTCPASLDVAGAPSFLNYFVGGRGLSRAIHTFRGTTTIDVAAPRNTSYYRSGTYRIYAHPGELQSIAGQSHRTNLCIHKPVSDDSSQGTKTFSEGELLILRRYWGDAAAKAPRVIYKLKDSSGCPADGLLFGVTPAMAGATITTTGVYQKGQPIVASIPFVAKNDKGEGAIYSLRGRSSA